MRLDYLLVAGLLLIPVTAATRAAEAPQAPATAPTTAPAATVDNPQFANWNRFNVGSNSTLTTNIETGGQKIATESTNTLVEKGADKVVVEVSGTMEVAGKRNAIPAQKQTIPAKIDSQSINKVAGEKIDAAGKTFDCAVYEMVNPDPAQKDAKAKVWISDEVPGGVVKLEANMPQGSVNGSLKSFEVK